MSSVFEKKNIASEKAYGVSTAMDSATFYRKQKERKEKGKDFQMPLDLILKKVQQKSSA